jgi:site-specific DNA recombinase
MITIGYVRVSTGRQVERGCSLEAQAEKIRAMALVQGAELSEIIVESGESAKSRTDLVWPSCSRWWTAAR